MVKIKVVDNNNLEKIRFESYSYPDKFIQHGTVDELEKIYGLDENKIIENIKNNILKNNILKNNIVKNKNI